MNRPLLRALCAALLILPLAAATFAPSGMVITNTNPDGGYTAAIGTKMALVTATTGADGTYSADVAAVAFTMTPNCQPTPIASVASAATALTATTLSTSSPTACRGFVTKPRATLVALGVTISPGDLAAEGVKVQILAIGQ